MLYMAPIYASSYWSSLDYAEDGAVNDVCFTDINTGWAVEYRNDLTAGRVLKTTDGGDNWTSQYSAANLELQKIYFTDSNNGWAVGYIDSTNTGYVLKTTNGGSLWSVNHTMNDVETFTSVFFVNSSTGWVGGYATDNSAIVLKTSNEGTNWTQQYTGTDAENKEIQDLYFVSATTGWLVGTDTSNDNALIISTMDGGTNWIRYAVESEYDQVTLYTVCFLDAHTGWAAGAQGSGNFIMSTTDGGTNWDYEAHTDLTTLCDIYFLNDNEGWAVGWNAGGNRSHIYYTDTGGYSWEEQYVYFSSGLRSLSIVGSGVIGYAAGSCTTTGAYTLIMKYKDTVPTTWYFAEGCTNGYDEWISIQNPDAVYSAEVNAQFMNEDGVVTDRDYTIGVESRSTICVNDLVPSSNVSVKLESTNGVGIFAARSMYWNSDSITRVGGHSVKGISETNTGWYFAEGCTNDFDEWIAILNPSSSETAAVTVTFVDSTGSSQQTSFNVSPSSRYSLAVDAIFPNSNVSAKVESTNSVGIVAERSMYWNSDSIEKVGGHCDEGSVTLQ